MVPRKRKQGNSGILSNSYIPPFSAIQIEKELQKLPPDSLYNLTHLWLSITPTQPTPSTTQIEQGYSKELLLKKYITRLENLKKIKSKINLKKKLINIILVEFYPQGLNTLQLAQIDVQLLVDKPNSNAWVSSTAKIIYKASDIPHDGLENNNPDTIKTNDLTRKEKLDKLSNYTFSLDSQLFLDNFISNLSNLFLTHVYISRHPYYPLLLIRVQMYNYTYRATKNSRVNEILLDLTNDSLDRMAKLKFEHDFQKIVNNRMHKKFNEKVNNNSLQRQIQIQNKPQLIPHKPFYILLPASSPHIIHTPLMAEDVSTKLILQTLETTLSQSNINSKKAKHTKRKDNEDLSDESLLNRKIKIFADFDIPNPVRNLNTIFVLKGISRFGSSIGAWVPYADDIVDIGILGDEMKHQTIQPEYYIDLTEDENKSEDNNEMDRKRVAALKFKGCITKLKSKKLFETCLNLDNNEVDYRGDSQIESDKSIEEIDDIDAINSFIDHRNSILKDPYSSIVPISECKFEIEDDIKTFFDKRKRNNKTKNKQASSSGTKFKFGLEFYGTDVFGGLHELSANNFIDPYTIPDWLTGESGSAGGIIKENKIEIE